MARWPSWAPTRMMAGRVGGLGRPSCYYCHYCDDYEGSGEGRMRKMGFGG